MCGFVLAIHKENNDKNLINNKLQQYCNLYIKSRGPSSQEIFKSNSIFAYQSTLAIKSANEKSKSISGVNY